MKVFDLFCLCNHGVRLTIGERVLVVKTFYGHNESYAETVRNRRKITGRNEAPNESTVGRLMTKFEGLNFWLGARRYDSYASTRLLRVRCGDQNLLPRSCGIIPLDFLFWGYVKAQVCENKP